MAGNSTFPAFIRVTADTSAFNEFASAGEGAAERVYRSFRQSAGEIDTAIKGALTAAKGGFAGIDLGEGKFRQLAAEARFSRDALGETLTAARNLAQITGDTSSATAGYIRQLSAQHIEAQRAADQADAQAAAMTRLQGITNAAISSNGALAASYRGLFSAQREAAQLQARQEALQQGINTRFATGLASRATDNGAGFEALAAKAAFDDLRDAQLSAARGADLVAAAYRGTSQELGRAATSARESAQVFIEAAQAQQRLANEAEQLRQQLDPMLAAQRRFDEELARADRLLAQGAISTREYAAAQQLARDNLRESAQQIAGTAVAEERLNRVRGQGTTANQLVVNSLSSQRFAMIQVGQQLQDITVGFASGQRAATIFAQQLPQLGFALTGFGGRLGAVGNFLAGPWGVAIFAATTALGFLAESFFAASSASDELKKQTLGLENALRSQRVATDEAKTALDEYNRTQLRTAENDALRIDNSIRAARADIAAAIATRQRIAAEIALQQNLRRESLRYSTNDAAFNGFTRSLANLDESNVGNEAQIGRLSQTLNNLEIERATREARSAVDPIQRINDAYDLQADAARRAARANRDLTASLQDRLTVIERNRRAELDAERESNRRPRRASQADPALPVVTAAEVRRILEERLGAQITSGARSAADNARVGGARNSYHTIGQAFDVGLNGRNGPISKDQIREALRAEGIDIRELLGPGDRGHDDHLHVAFGRRRQRPDATARQEGAEERRAQALAQSLAQANEQITRFREQFDQTPREVDRVEQAIRSMNAAIAEAQGRGATPEQVATLRAQATIAEQTARDSLRRPVEENIRAGDREIELARLRASGSQDQVDQLEAQNSLMDQLGVTTREQLATEIARRGISAEQIERMERQRVTMREMAREQERLDRAGISVVARLKEVETVNQGIEKALSAAPDDARGAIAGFAEGIRRQFNDIFARQITETIFGDTFANLQDEISNNPRVRADRAVADSSNQVRTAFDDLAESVRVASAQMQSAANDNGDFNVVGTNRNPFVAVPGAEYQPDISNVTGRRGAGGGASPTNAVDVMQLTFTRLFERFLGEDAPLASALGGALKSGLTGAAIGGSVGSLLFGRRNSPLGSQLGGAAGNAIGNAIGGPAGGQIGSIIGSIAGNVVAGLFRKIPTSSTSLSSVGGAFTVAGNNAQGQSAVGGVAGNIQSGLQRIIEQLGGTAGSFGVSVGQRNDYFRVSGSANADTTSKRAGNLLYDGTDAAEATRIAILNAIQDGAVQGIREGSKRLLAAGKDLDSAVAKALKFESVFTRLKAIDDPVGGALDTLDKEFRNLKTVFSEAGASAAEYADLERLYGIERAKVIKQVGEQTVSSLRSLLNDLTVGNDALSLRTRQSQARSAYDPLAARVAAGDRTAYDEFANAAKQLLEIQRSISGSGTGYFSLLDEVTRLTQQRIDSETNVASIAAGRDSPFNANGQPTGAINDNQPIVDALQSQTAALIAASQSSAAAIIAAINAGGGAGLASGNFLAVNNF